jgi:hypothetical protein
MSSRQMTPQFRFEFQTATLSLVVAPPDRAIHPASVIASVSEAIQDHGKAACEALDCFVASLLAMTTQQGNVVVSGATACAEHDGGQGAVSRSRGMTCPSYSSEPPSKRRRGRREGRMLAAPMARLQQKKQAAVTTGTSRTTGLPCAMV